MAQREVKRAEVVFGVEGAEEQGDSEVEGKCEGAEAEHGVCNRFVCIPTRCLGAS